MRNFVIVVLILLVLAVKYGNRIYQRSDSRENTEQTVTNLPTHKGETQNVSNSPSPPIVEGSPVHVVNSYLQAMANNNSDPNLPIYTDASKRMLQGWNVTNGQMQNISSAYKRCTLEATKIRTTYAVVRYPIGQRECSPFFLRQKDGVWRLDLTVMMGAIRFNTQNAWSLNRNDLDLGYRFSFSDWSFDENGYPQK